MNSGDARLAIAVLGLLLTAGCTGKVQDKRPVLTKDAFYAAAKTCNAKDPMFIARAQGLPSFSFLDETPREPTVAANPTSQCLADALKGYRFQSMEIRFNPTKAPRK